jgi:hypothetical protein
MEIGRGIYESAMSWSDSALKIYRNGNQEMNATVMHNAPIVGEIPEVLSRDSFYFDGEIV